MSNLFKSKFPGKGETGKFSVWVLVLSPSSCLVSGSPAASPDSSDNSDTQHSGGSDMEMDDQMMTGSKRSQQRLSDTEVH